MPCGRVRAYASRYRWILPRAVADEFQKIFVERFLKLACIVEVVSRLFSSLVGPAPTDRGRSLAESIQFFGGRLKKAPAIFSERIQTIPNSFQ